jgi:hypothetical protein
MASIAPVKVATLVEQLQKELTDLSYDVSKADMGQKAARRRIRKAMQQFKTKAQDIRVLLVPKK